MNITNKLYDIYIIFCSNLSLYYLYKKTRKKNKIINASTLIRLTVNEKFIYYKKNNNNCNYI